LRAASLNYRDLALLEGRYLALGAPVVPGSDGVGEVVAVGPGVRRFAVGQRAIPVYVPGWRTGRPDAEAVRRRLGGPQDGVLREYLCVPEEEATPAPAHLSDAEAATLPIAGVTAWRALVAEGRLRPGDTVVVQGTGGVSLFGLQLARLAGARVLVTSRSAEKLARVEALGAAHGIDTSATPDWEAEVLRLTGGRGADHVLDVLGGAQVQRSLAAARLGGTVSLVGFLTGLEARFDLGLALRRMVRLQAVSVGSREDQEALGAALEAHGVRPVVDRVFPFEELPAAYAHLASGAQLGKVVVRFG
jgi:NADPH:quinone reductase-like Zn-dependent oxidoreductase